MADAGDQGDAKLSGTMKVSELKLRAIWCADTDHAVARHQQADRAKALTSAK
jgi:hypothetical protein